MGGLAGRRAGLVPFRSPPGYAAEWFGTFLGVVEATGQGDPEPAASVEPESPADVLAQSGRPPGTTTLVISGSGVPGWKPE